LIFLIFFLRVDEYGENSQSFYDKFFVEETSEMSGHQGVGVNSGLLPVWKVDRLPDWSMLQ